MKEIHGIAATFFHIQRLNLPDDDASKMARALHEYNKYHPLPVLPPDKVALAMLIGTTFRVYGSMARDIIEEKQKPVPRPAPVTSVAKPAQDNTPTGVASVETATGWEWADAGSPRH